MKITRSDILDCWIAEPSLVYYGLAVNMSRLGSGRIDLMNALDEVQLCYDWIMLQNIGEIVSPGSQNSFSLVSWVEGAARRAGIGPVSLGNGCFIAATILAGVPYRRIDKQIVYQNKGDSQFIAVNNVQVAIKPIRLEGRRSSGGPYRHYKSFPIQHRV